MPARNRKPPVPELSPETWRGLYEAADAFGELRLWECMGDSELLGVDDPRTGEPVLGAVMGGRGEVFGLALHHGPAGLRWVIELATADKPELDIDAFLSIAVLKVEFVPRRELPQEDRQRVKALGFSPRGGRGAKWPTFLSHRPGYVPWHIDEDDARLLLDVLPRMTALGAAVRPLYESDDDFSSDGFAFWPRGRTPGEPLAFEQIEWRHVAMPPEPAPDAFVVDEATAATLAKLPRKDAVIELAAFAGVGGISEGGEGERPWAIKAALAVEARSGIVANLELGQSPGDTLEAIAGRALIGAMKSLRIRPAAVHLTSRRAMESLTPFANRMDIQLTIRRELPGVDAARASMPPQFGFGMPM